jgi:hypothetical protein
MQQDCRRVAGKVANRRKSSRDRQRVRDGTTNLLVGKGETISIEGVREELARIERVEQHEEELREQLEVEKMQREEKRRQSVPLTEALDAATNKGRKLEEVGERQRRRKIAQLKSYATVALQPMESYGLTPQKVTAVTQQGAAVTLELGEGPIQQGDAVTMELGEGPSSSSGPAEPEGNPSNILFLLDRFGVSDEFYHELAQVVKELPRLHHIKQLRKELNSSVNSVRLDPPYNGCYVHIRATVSQALSSPLSRGPHAPNTTRCF